MQVAALTDDLTAYQGRCSHVGRMYWIRPTWRLMCWSVMRPAADNSCTVPSTISCRIFLRWSLAPRRQTQYHPADTSCRSAAADGHRFPPWSDDPYNRAWQRHTPADVPAI